MLLSFSIWRLHSALLVLKTLVDLKLFSFMKKPRRNLTTNLMLVLSKLNKIPTTLVEMFTLWRTKSVSSKTQEAKNIWR